MCFSRYFPFKYRASHNAKAVHKTTSKRKKRKKENVMLKQQNESLKTPLVAVLSFYVHGYGH